MKFPQALLASDLYKMQQNLKHIFNKIVYLSYFLGKIIYKRNFVTVFLRMWSGTLSFSGTWADASTLLCFLLSILFLLFLILICPLLLWFLSWNQDKVWGVSCKLQLDFTSSQSLPCQYLTLSILPCIPQIEDQTLPPPSSHPVCLSTNNWSQGDRDK